MVFTKTYFEGEEILKVFNLSGELYAVKYVKDGNVYTKSVLSYWLKDLNVKSVTIRGEKTIVSLLSAPHKNLTLKTYDCLKTTLLNTDKLKLYKQFHTIKKLISNSSKPKDITQYLFDLEYGELNFVVATRYIKDYALGAKVTNTFEGELVHYLLSLGYLQYKPKKEMGLFHKKWTKDQQKRFKRHRIYSS